MKKFFILSAIMLFSVLLSMGAGDQSHKLLKSIPRSAETVILADLNRISDQSGYSRVELISMLCSQVSPLMANIVSTMAEDGEIGVDLSGDIALFNTTDHEPLIGALKLSDADAVKRFLKSQAERESSLSHYQKGDVSGCYNDDFYLLCDKNVLLLIAGEQGKDVKYFATMFATKGEGFYLTKLGQALSACGGELRAVSSADIGLSEEMAILTKEGLGIVMSVETLGDVSDVEIEVVALTQEAEEYLAQMGATVKPLTGQLLKYIPESAIALAIVSKSPGSDSSQLKSLESQLVAQADDETAQVLKSVLGQIDGDVALAVQGEEKSQFTILCQSKGDALLTTIRNKIDCDWVQQGRGYVGKMGDMTLYMGSADGVAAISTHSAVTDLKYADKPKMVNIEDLYAYLSLDVKGLGLTNVLQSVSQDVNSVQNVKRAILIQMIASTFDEVEFRLMNSKMQIKLDLAGEGNSIYSLLKP